jgi:hypothetical protein
MFKLLSVNKVVIILKHIFIGFLTFPVPDIFHKRNLLVLFSHRTGRLPLEKTGGALLVVALFIEKHHLLNRLRQERVLVPELLLIHYRSHRGESPLKVSLRRHGNRICEILQKMLST